MKNSPRFEEIQRIAKNRAYYIKCLAKDIKLSSHLGGNPSNFYFHFYFDNLVLFDLECFE